MIFFKLKKKKKELSVCFVQPPGSAVCTPCWTSKPDILGAHLPGLAPQAGKPDVVLDPSVLGENPCSGDCLLMGQLLGRGPGQLVLVVLRGHVRLGLGTR